MEAPPFARHIPIGNRTFLPTTIFAVSCYPCAAKYTFITGNSLCLGHISERYMNGASASSPASGNRLSVEVANTCRNKLALPTVQLLPTSIHCSLQSAALFLNILENGQCERILEDAGFQPSVHDFLPAAKLRMSLDHVCRLLHLPTLRIFD